MTLALLPPAHDTSAQFLSMHNVGNSQRLNLVRVCVCVVVVALCVYVWVCVWMQCVYVWMQGMYGEEMYE